MSAIPRLRAVSRLFWLREVTAMCAVRPFRAFIWRQRTQSSQCPPRLYGQKAAFMSAITYSKKSARAFTTWRIFKSNRNLSASEGHSRPAGTMMPLDFKKPSAAVASRFLRCPSDRQGADDQKIRETVWHHCRDYVFDLWSRQAIFYYEP